MTVRASRVAILALLVACASVAVATRAAAQTGPTGQAGDPAAADALFQKGREAAEKHDWAAACPKFAESQRLDPALGTLLNLADCEEHTGRLASAYEHFKTALETMPPTDDRLGFTKQRIAGLEKTVPHLTLEAPPGLPEGTRVTRDDVQLGSASFGLALPVNPGQHTILVTAPGRADKRLTVVLKAGEAETVRLPVGEAVPSAPPSSHALGSPQVPRASTNADGSGNGSGLRTAGFVVGAVGLVSAGVGAVTGLMVIGKKSIVDDPTHCDPTTHVCDSTGLDAASAGKTLSTVSTAAFVAGGALLVTGIVLVLSGGPSGHTGAASMALVGPETYAGGGAGLRVIGTF